MTDVPKDLKYTEEHEWLRIEDGKARLGITDYAQHQLSDVVYIEFPEVGKDVTKGDTLGVVESVKSVSDVYTPVSGKVIEVNSPLADTPEIISTDPYGKGWIALIELSDPSQIDDLMDASAYKTHIGE